MIKFVNSANIIIGTFAILVGVTMVIVIGNPTTTFMWFEHYYGIGLIVSGILMDVFIITKTEKKVFKNLKIVINNLKSKDTTLHH